MKLKDLNKSELKKDENFEVDDEELMKRFSEFSVFDYLKDVILNKKTYLEIKTEKKYLNDNWSSEKIKRNLFINYFDILIQSLKDDEKEFLFDLSYEKNPIFTDILLNCKNIKIKSETINKILNLDYSKVSVSDAKEIKRSLIENNNIPLNENLVNEEFLKNEEFSSFYGKRKELDVKKIDILLTKVNCYGYIDEDTLESILDNKFIKLTEKQIDFCLNSNNFNIRKKCSGNYHYQFNKEQVLKGLNDEGFELSGYETEDTYPSDVIINFLKNPNIKIPKNYIKHVLNKNLDLEFLDNEQIFELLTQRKDIVFNAEEIDNLSLNLEDGRLYKLINNQTVKLNDNTILKLLYKSDNSANFMCEKYFKNENVEISELILNVLKIMPNLKIQNFLKEKEGFNTNLEKKQQKLK